ncbi:restriction endonuclease subunit S [Gordonia iterans]
MPNQPAVRLCNYVDVYKNDEIDESIEFMRATATPDQVERFRLKVGDTLLTKDSETADDIGIPAFVRYEAADLVCGYHLSIVRPRVGAVFPRYLFWALGSMPVFDQWAVLASGVTRVGIRAGDLAKAAILLPPMDEQRAIADFLDRETARIDTLIEEQQRLINLLRERRDAEWSSGLEAAKKFGREVQVRRVLGSIVDGPFGSSLTSAHYSDKGARVIRLGNIGTGEFRDDDKAFVSLEYAERLSAHAAVPGDVVIAGLGDEKMPLGRAAVVPDIGPAIVKADCYRARPTDDVSSEYLAWALSAPPTRVQIGLLARGATRARLNTSVVQQVTIPLPPRNLQEACLQRWVSQASKIDTLIAETEKFVELSRERRAALITAAVTGQIDVRAAV